MIRYKSEEIKEGNEDFSITLKNNHQMLHKNID